MCFSSFQIVWLKFFGIREDRKFSVVKLWIVPGITGEAQIHKIDMSTPQLLAETDAQMTKNVSIGNYFGYIFQTISGRGMGDRIVKK